MLRPSPNHGTLLLPNDDDDESICASELELQIEMETDITMLIGPTMATWSKWTPNTCLPNTRNKTKWQKEAKYVTLHILCFLKVYKTPLLVSKGRIVVDSALGVCVCVCLTLGVRSSA